MHPSVSSIYVVVPARNVSAFIGDMLESLKGQIEIGRIIIVDDGSEDQTKEVIRVQREGLPVQSCYSLVEHHNQYFAKNVALHEMFEEGCSLKKPDFIAFMDADDLSYPDRFRRQWEIMDEHPDVWGVGGGCHNIAEDGTSDTSNDCVAWPLEKDPLLKGVRQYGIGLWNATALYRSEVFDWLGSFDYAPGMGDTEWFVRLVWASVLANKKLVNIQDPVIHRRVRGTQVSEIDSKVGSPWRVAYEPFLKQKFIFLRTLHALGKLSKFHVYRGNEVQSEDFTSII